MHNVRPVWWTPSVLLLLLCANACSNGGGGSPPPSLEASQDTLAAGSAVPEVILEGGNATARFWTGAMGEVVLAQVQNGNSAADSVFVSMALGQVVRIDSGDGTFVLVEDRSANRVDFSEFDANGDYVRGTAVVQTGTAGIDVARIRGAAAFDGQVAGQLTLPSLSGSYALVSKITSEVEAPTGLDAQTVKLSEGLASQIVPAGTAPALANPRVSLALRWAGILALAAENGPRARAYGLAGIAMLLSGIGGASITDYIGLRFATGDPKAQELVDLALEFVADPSAGDVVAFWRLVRERFDDGQAAQNPSLEQLKAALDVGAQPPQGVASISAPTGVTLPQSGPPRITVDLEGQAVWQDGAFYPLTGTIDAQGRIDVVGMRDGNDPNDMLTVVADVDTANSLVSGGCDRAGTAGTVNGSTEPIGACNVARQSGGQGTFSFAQFIGPGQGDVVFDYQAFSIPDQFIVRTAQGLKFDTGGLVSGSASITIPIDNEPIVFVSVRAPRNGTAWNYTLGCLN